VGTVGAGDTTDVASGVATAGRGRMRPARLSDWVTPGGWQGESNRIRAGRAESLGHVLAEMSARTPRTGETPGAHARPPCANSCPSLDNLRGVTARPPCPGAAPIHNPWQTGTRRIRRYTLRLRIPPSWWSLAADPSSCEGAPLPNTSNTGPNRCQAKNPKNFARIIGRMSRGTGEQIVTRQTCFPQAMPRGAMATFA
jgi:hypothetical protein